MAGIVQRIYLNGYVFNFPPSVVDPLPTFGESVRRARDGALLDHTHRAVITDPDVPSKFRFTVEWDELTDEDVDTFLECVALRGPLDFCPWMRWKESFTFLSGESIAGNFQRGSAKDEIPLTLATGTPATDFDVTFKLDGVASTAFSVGAMDAGRTPWASDPSATAGGGGAIVIGCYAPLFTVRVVEQALTMKSHAQGGRLVLEEY